MKTIYERDNTGIAYRCGGQGPPVLLVHGSIGDHRSWQLVWPSLERRFRVYAMDRRGHGASTDGSTYRFENEWRDIATLVDAIGGPVDVVGHSFGATCALEAARLTTNIRRLVLYEPPMPFGRQFWPAAFGDRMQASLDAGMPEEALVLFLREFLSIPTADLAVARASPNWPAQIAAAQTIPRELQGLDAYTVDRESLRALRIPTLLLLGGNTLPALKTETLHLQGLLPSCRVAVMAGQGHAAMRTAPDVLAQEIIQFFTADKAP